MRALQTKDLGLFSKIVSKIDIQEEIKKMMVTVDATGKTKAEIQLAKEQAEEEMGINLMMFVLENYWKAEKEVFRLLASLTGKTMKEVEELPLDEFIGLLTQLKDDESLVSFFKLVAG